MIPIKRCSLLANFSSSPLLRIHGSPRTSQKLQSLSAWSKRLSPSRQLVSASVSGHSGEILFCADEQHSPHYDGSTTSIRTTEISNPLRIWVWPVLRSYIPVRQWRALTCRAVDPSDLSIFFVLVSFHDCNAQSQLSLTPEICRLMTAALRTIGGSVYLFVPFVWLSVTDLSPFWLAEIEPSIGSPHHVRRHISAELKKVALHLAVVKGYKYKKIRRITWISERTTQCVQALHQRLLVVGIFQGIFSMVSRVSMHQLKKNAMGDAS